MAGQLKIDAHRWNTKYFTSFVVPLFRKLSKERETQKRRPVIRSRTVFADDEILSCRNSVESLKILNFNYFNQFLLSEEVQSLKKKSWSLSLTQNEYINRILIKGSSRLWAPTEA